MAEVNQVEPIQEIPENIDPSTTEPAKEPTVQEIIEQAKADLDEKYKTEIAGLNRKVSEVSTELDAERKAKMTEKERVETELEEARAATEAERQITLKLTQGRIIDSELSSVGLPLEFAKYIRGEDEEQIKANVKGINDLIVKTANELKEKDINIRLSGKGPAAGGSPDLTNLQAAYNEAKKSGNDALKISIKRQAGREGITII